MVHKLLKQFFTLHGSNLGSFSLPTHVGKDEPPPNPHLNTTLSMSTDLRPNSLKSVRTAYSPAVV